MDRGLVDEIAREVEAIYKEAIDPLSGKFSFETRPGPGEILGPPTVLFLGNHSSGKSTFINFLLGKEIQRTGVAPTDDAFTLISHGEKEEVRDGNAIVSNPDLPFGDLRGFGPMLLSHLKLKIVPHELLCQVTLIDSPGMIDAAKEESGRGYDFTGVVRWFARRADVLIFFFDPDKPGTTGETLHVFTEALQDVDHKLLIVMNKVDRFASMRDFARAYGALCWNLGKVIPRKDLPMIFTTYVPVQGAAETRLPMGDFDQAREELIQEIRRAPARRADNMITQLQEHAQRLQLHSRVTSRAVQERRQYAFQAWGIWICILILLALLGTAAMARATEWWIPACIFAGAGVWGYLSWYGVKRLIRRQEGMILAGLQSLFEQVYMRDLLVRERAQDLTSVWEATLPRTRKTLETLGLSRFRKLSREDDNRLRKALEERIPELRSRLHRAVGVSRAPAASK